MSKIIGGNFAGGMSQEEMEERQRLLQMAKWIKEAADYPCEACGCLNFIHIYRIRKISGLVTGTGKDTLAPVPVYACADCGHVNDRFMKSVGLLGDDDKKEETKEPDAEGQV